MSEEEIRCKATTGDGDQCNNRATIPKENPKACHLESHQKQLNVYKKEGEKTMSEEKSAKKTEKTDEIPNVKNHVFASKHLSHTIFVNYPEDDERNHFRAQFNGGRFETNNDEKAKLLKKQVENDRNLSKKIEKVK